MTVDEARAVLGLGPHAPPEELRGAFVRQVRATHPDTTDHPLGAAERTATVITAYRLLRDLPPREPAEEPLEERPAGPPAPDLVEVIADEALWVGAPEAIVGRIVVEAADDVGDVSYVDRSIGMVQCTVRPPDGPTCWLTISTHARPGGTVVVATLESIEAAPTPPTAPVLAALARSLHDRLAELPPISTSA